MGPKCLKNGLKRDLRPRLLGVLLIRGFAGGFFWGGIPLPTLMYALLPLVSRELLEEEYDPERDWAVDRLAKDHYREGRVPDQNRVHHHYGRC